MAFDVASAIQTTADQYGVDPDLALKVARAESGLNPAAVSPKGAVGPMQLMPRTAKGLGVDPHDVQQNIVGGVKYLRQLSDRYGGDHQLIAAAYNAGPDAVDKHGGVPPYPETQAYVQKVTGQAPPNALPSPDAVLKSIGYTAPAKSPEPTAPGGGEPLPSPDDVLKGIGWKAPAAVAAPKQTAAQAAAAKDAQATEDPSNAGKETFINSALLNGLPLLKGGAAALGVGVDNSLAKLGMDTGHAYGPSEAFTAYRGAQQSALDAYAAAHPVASGALGVGGFIASGPGAALEKATGAALTRVAPKLATKLAGRLAITGTKAGVIGATAGGAQGASEGESAPQIATDAVVSGAVNAPFGMAAHALGNVPVRSPVAKAVVAPALGAALGGGLGYAQGGKQGAELGATTGAMAGLRFTPKGSAEVTPRDHATALDLVAKAAPEAADALSAAPSHLTTAEALGPSGQAMTRTAAAGGETAIAPIKDALGQRGDAGAVIGRLSDDVRAVTGIAPETAQADIGHQVDEIKQTTAKPAWDAVDLKAPTFNDDIGQLIKEPEVRSALDWARRKIGSGAMTDNPEARITDDGRPIVSAEDYRTWLRTGNQQVENLLNPGAKPAIVPTAEALIMAQRDLAGNVARDPITKQVLPDSVAPGNSKNAHWAAVLNDAIKKAVPGLAEAKAASGDYLSAGQAYQSGRGLWSTGANAETSAAFTKRYGDLTPGEQIATQRGYMAELYRRMENAKSFDPGQAATPFHKAAQETMFGNDRAAQIQAALQREQSLAASAKATMSSARAPKESDGGHGVGPATGAVIGFAEGGVHGAVKGAMGGAAAKGASGVMRALADGRTTPAVRHALGEILSKPPGETADALKGAKARRETKLSESTLHKRILEHAFRGLGATAGTQAAHALEGAPEDGQ